MCAPLNMFWLVFNCLCWGVGRYVGKHDGGTIRGKKNGVRRSLQVITGGSSIKDVVLRQLYLNERDKIVVYTTTLTAVRSTLNACNRIMKLFDTLRLKVQVGHETVLHDLRR